jgi:hypothetical protein
MLDPFLLQYIKKSHSIQNTSIINKLVVIILGINKVWILLISIYINYSHLKQYFI